MKIELKIANDNVKSSITYDRIVNFIQDVFHSPNSTDALKQESKELLYSLEKELEKTFKGKKWKRT
jgi:hypothetical protein